MSALVFKRFSSKYALGVSALATAPGGE